LAGSIPLALGMLPLEFLNLSRNKLSGKIPSFRGRINSILGLKLSQNALSGTIPSNLGTFTWLFMLHLDGNKLTGTIPSSLRKLTDLSELYLHSNFLTGTIPSSLCESVTGDKDYLIDCQEIFCECCLSGVTYKSCEEQI
jgi:Leucine-rich repeat (LRR) protein